MIPVISTTPVVAPFTERVALYNKPLLDYENGGPILGEQTDDISYEWTAATDGSIIWVVRDGVPPETFVTDIYINQVSFAFDSTMNPHIAYVSNGVSKFYWFDSLLGDFDTMTLVGARSPRVCTDEKNPLLSSDRDTILSYIKGDELCFRVQRERFQTEHVFTTGIAEASILSNVCMNKARRLQFELVSPLVQ